MKLKDLLHNTKRREIKRVVTYNDGETREFKIYDFYFIQFHKRIKKDA